MKRQVFRLGGVLRYYLLQKQRAELELRRASRALNEMEAEMAQLSAAIAGLAALVQGQETAPLTTAGWIACYQKAENLDRRLRAVQARREAHLQAMRELEEKRKRWALAEETLLTLRRAMEDKNDAEAAKAGQMLLDEAVLRRWLGHDTPLNLEN